LKKEKQIANMQAILQALFPTMGEISKNYVLASIEDREISNIGKVSDAFSQLARDYKGEVETKIISAEVRASSTLIRLTRFFQRCG